MPELKAMHDRQVQQVFEAQDTLERVAALSGADLVGRLDATGVPCVGAKPSGEYRSGGLMLNGIDYPTNRRASVEFTASVLSQHSTAFVDGSQIEVNKDHNIPWGAVNIAGSHNVPGEPLALHEDFQFITRPHMQEYVDQGVTSPNHIIHFLRWRMELDYLESVMRKHPGTFCFFDGSLVNSFAMSFRDELRVLYTQAINHVLRTSKETQSPIIGYIDTSQSRDITDMLTHLEGIEGGDITDHMLLDQVLAKTGCRSHVWICDRGDGSIAEYEQTIHFHLANFGPGGVCRIEYPEWVSDAGLHVTVHEILAAQTLAYFGYPRSFDEVHNKATITYKDRDAITRSFQAVCAKHGITFRKNRKSASKAWRLLQ